MKDIASIAADAADHAMKANAAPPNAAKQSAAYIPLAAIRSRYLTKSSRNHD
jgi:hypothetical protein